ncbi:MAG: hypothetical protein U0S76_11570, partial [Pseudoxanthomonas sp.]|nr:hypothetical protein [Pseudoxanthomonas sp.]
MSQQVLRARRASSGRRSGLAAIALSALLPALPALATTYSVGSGPACTHLTLLSAINAAVADASPGPHLIKIDTGNRLISNYEIVNPAQDIILEGGYASCTDPAPAVGQRSTLDSGGVSGARVFRIANDNSNARRTIRLRNLTLTGGLNPSTQLGWGGGIHAQGRLNLYLESETYIDGNSASNGGGIALFNLTANPDQFTRLRLASGSRVCLNAATGPGSNGNGGGIHAIGGTEVTIWRGSVCNNEARR